MATHSRQRDCCLAKQLRKNCYIRAFKAHLAMLMIFHSKQTYFMLLAAVGLFSMMGCRDFQDARTPYKSYVTVEFSPTDDDEKLTISSIEQTANAREVFKPKGGAVYEIPLDSAVNTMTFSVHSNASDSPHTLTINYKKIISLISHERGGQYIYVLTKVTTTLGKEHKIINEQLSEVNDSPTDIQIYY